MKIRYRTVAAAIATAVALAIPVTISAGGEPPPAPDDVTVIGMRRSGILFEGPLGRIYGTGDNGYVLAGPIEDVCTQPPPQVRGITRRQPNRLWTTRPVFGGLVVDMYLYEVEVGTGVFDFLGQVCPGGAPYPEPFAVGTGWLIERSRNVSEPYWSFLGPQPTGDYRNSTTGIVRTPEGEQFIVRAVADYTVNADGPPDFRRETLRVRPLGERQ